MKEFKIEHEGKESIEKRIERERVNKDYLVKILEKSREFYNRKESVTNIEEQVEQYLEILRENEYINSQLVSSIGIGYPFYNLEHSGEILPEIQEFHDKTRLKSDKSILGDEEWEYIQCHQADNFNDFKTQCSVCNKVDFKPRDIMKLIPDIDLFIVVEEINEEILEEVEKVSYDNEYTPSDIDIEKTLKETEETIDKNIEKNKFPMDIHLIDKEKFLSTLDEGIKGAYGQEIEMLAMYKGWKSIKLKILYSLVFSAEFLDDIKDNSLKGKIKEFYKNFFKKYDTFDKYVGFLKEGNVRVAKLLEDKHILKQFKKKFNRLNK